VWQIPSMATVLWLPSCIQSHIATDGQSVSLGVETHLDLMTKYLLVFDSYGFVFRGAPSLTRGRVCLFYMLLTFASSACLASESLGTRDRMLLSQIWDFPFRRRLRLAGSRWVYSTPPPHGWHHHFTWPGGLVYSFGSDPTENTVSNNSCIVVGVLTDPLPRNGRWFFRSFHSNGCTRYNMKMKCMTLVWPAAT
jgi:hypothetical protein